MRRTLGWLGTIVLLGAMPLSAACGPSEEDEEFNFDADDMRAAIEGAWSGTVTRDDGSIETMALTLTYTAPAKSAACGNRVLGAEAPRPQPLCDTQSSIGLTGSMTVDGGELSSAAVAGSFYVSGAQMQNGFLEVEVSQKNPPPDETVLTVNASGYLQGDKLIVTLSDDANEFELSRD